MIVKTYTLGIDQHNRLYQVCRREVDSMMTQEAAGAELDRRAKKYAIAHGLDPVKHYGSILHRIISEANDELVEAYTGARVRQKKESTTPADEVHARAEDYSRKHGLDYSSALREVLASDAELREAYGS